MIKRILVSLVLFVFIFTILFIFSNYIDTNINKLKSFTSFKYFNLLMVIQLIGISFFLIVQFLNSVKIKSVFYTPVSFIIQSTIFSILIYYVFSKYIGFSLDLTYALTIVRSQIFILIILLGIIILIPLFKIFLTDKVQNFSFLASISLSCLVFIIFIFASLEYLSIVSITIIFLLLIIFSKKYFLQNFKKILEPIDNHQNINYWGFIIFYLLLIALTINFLAIQSPYPYGFDARNYYMNSTQLIAQSQGLIEGFQPYNWQLFMSLGFILFDSHEVAISLSFFAFILCLVAINDFTKDVFKLGINYRLLIMLLITVSPAFYNQLSIDVKIDFALMFYQIVIVHLFVKLCQAKEWNWKLIIIFGLLNGFALGIKFTHLYLLASMIIVYWGIQGGVIALISGATISVGAFLIAKIDDVGGLRSAHLGVDYQQWIVLAIGAGLFIFLAISEREKCLKLMRFSLLFGAIAVIPMLPWIGKNYIETKSLSPKTLLMGKAPGYQMNLNSFIKNYEAQK